MSVILDSVAVTPEVEVRCLPYIELARRAFPDGVGVVIAVEHVRLHRMTARAARRLLLHYDYPRQARIVEEHDERLGLLVVVCLDDDSAVCSLIPRSAGAAA